MRLLRTLLKALLLSSQLSHAFVIPEARSTKAITAHDAARRDVTAHELDSIFPRAGTCPKVKLVKGKKCTPAAGTRSSGGCPPPPSSKNPNVAPKTPGQSSKPSPKPKVSKKPPKRSDGQRLEEEIRALTFEERADKTLDEMNEIASFEWAVGDTATTIGLAGCSVIAIYNDKAIVWGHYSPVISDGKTIIKDYQEVLHMALTRIESKAQSMGILGTGRARGVVRVDKRAALVPVPQGMPNIPMIIVNWFANVGVIKDKINRGFYDGRELADGTCSIKHITAGNAEVRMS
ncbi:hypothetical protein E8E13_005178 [Curvularia kusanoi]|uniref:Uncharacterized protein n=1 Tax=Curvularia kusanoi TaxID=90978 RepID=A0A9P4TIP0_CURKU|nr:hypothetical protein E8E13_005178 [Curvularia kusanoi]